MLIYCHNFRNMQGVSFDNDEPVRKQVPPRLERNIMITYTIIYTVITLSNILLLIYSQAKTGIS